MPTRFLSFLLFSSLTRLYPADLPISHRPTPVLSAASLPNSYAWSVKPVGDTAELLTLSCHHCGPTPGSEADVPLLSVLRDTLGDSSPESSRLIYVWLLSAGHYNLGQRILSAVPFFYWRLGSSSVSPGPGYPAPLLNLNAPLHPVLAEAGRSVVQWAAFDPLATSVRASSRSYQANQTDNDRFHLEQAIGHLQNAPPVKDGVGLSEQEIDTLIARLELRKSFLGGLLITQRTARFGQQARFEEERVRRRNSELLRQLAEKTGSYFEPLTLAGNTGGFAILWLPANTSEPVTGVASKPIWKLLNIRNPWSDSNLVAGNGLTFQRAFDADGKLLPDGADGVRSVTLVPLAVYSLSYPQMPLLLVDFHNGSSIRRHELLQRSITEATSGVLGISHFANWYYYAGAFAYHTLWSRKGTASDQAERLDCYAEFRSHLALDVQLDPRLRKELLARAGSLNVNPLDSDPARSLANARIQYARLERAAAGHELSDQLDRERRAELAAFGQSPRATATQETLHLLSFGAYTHRAAVDPENITRLNRDRRISYQLDWLDAALQNGTDPRVSLSSAQLDESVEELRFLIENTPAEPVRQHAKATLARLQTLSLDSGEQTANTGQITHSVALR